MQRWFLPGLGLAVVIVIAVVVALPSFGDAGEPNPVVVVTPTPEGPGATPSVVGGPPAAEDVLLRLTDLPPGYMVGDDSGCGAITPEGAGDPLNQYIAGEFPEFCRRQLEYVCQTRPSGRAAIVESTVVFLSSEQKAAEGLLVVPSMARWLAGMEVVAQRNDAPTLGDEAIAFNAQLFYENEGALVAWRNGTVLNLVGVGGLPADEALPLAADLARVQDHRFTNPEPAAPSDTDDVTVPLACRDSQVPVYWVGQTFEGNDMPEATLELVRGPVPPGGGPGDTYMLDYDGPQGSPGFVLSVWTFEEWETFLGSEIGRFATSRPCAEPEVTELDDRTIEVHPPTESCGQRHMAHVEFEDVIVTINVPYGLCCVGPLPSGPSPFDTPEALEQIARALTRRE